MSHKDTDEQVEIKDVVHTGVDTVIEAGAGTGKTTTLKGIAAREHEAGRSGICIYFNRAPAHEAAREFSRFGVQCSTAHSLAWHAMKDEPYMRRLDGPKVTAKMIAEDHLGLTKWFRTQPGRKDISTWKIASLAVQAVQRFCYSDAEEIKPWHVPVKEFQLPPEFEDELRAEVLPFAREIWSDLQKADGFAQFTPDHYMKLWALTYPELQADYMMVDESQDTNGVLAGIVRRQDHLQRIFVGDTNQRLFSWRGTVDLSKEFGEKAEVRYLTQSFRFGDHIAEEANRWLEYLQADLRLRGTPSINSRLDFIESPDAILCRTNAATIEQAMDAQQRGFDVAIVGGTDEIASFAAAVEQLKRMGKTSHRELSIFKSWNDVLEYVREEKPGGNFGTAVNLINRYGTDGVQAVAARCVSPSKADFVVSTVHKVKGMEWGKVSLDPSLAPDEGVEAQGDLEMSRGELMVGYVAATRAKEVLDVAAVQPFHRRRARLRELAAQTEKMNKQVEVLDA
jgi:superfamily I DNA/RNA helicase